MNESIVCGDCPSHSKTSLKDISALKLHYRNRHPFYKSFRCGHCGCLMANKTSLIRHVKEMHLDALPASGQNLSGQHVECASASQLQLAQTCADSEEDWSDPDNPDAGNQDATSSIDQQVALPPVIDLNKVAAEVILELRARGSLTGKAISRFQDGCLKLLKCQHAEIVNKFTELLQAKGMPAFEIDALVREVGEVKDVFTGLKTIDEQLEYFAKEYGLVKPKQYYLGPRLDKRLDPKTNLFIQSEVHATFEYISITEQLQTILSNKDLRNIIFKDLTSKDGVLRSYVDGSHCKDHPFLVLHKNVIYILLFYDELEVAGALGAKTSIHKLGVFLFQILNLPAHMSSRLSSIHLLALAYAEDLKGAGAYERVLSLFVLEMKKLSSDEGVKIVVDGEEIILRALLVGLSADTLAAHNLLGFLPPSARHFCRQCMIARPDFRQDGNHEAQLRTKEEHDRQVNEVELKPSYSTRYGVKRSCPLNEVPFFHCVEGSIFDAFHDVLEGVVPSVVKLVLRYFIIKRELFTVSEFNVRVSSFCYGNPDSRNKPSANFMTQMLTSRKNLRQGGCQMWCLMRALPFLICDGIECTEEAQKHMELVFLVQDA